jgi:predicted RNA-binding Zn-ribbon protein involved in translation (DUF1610 family)
VADRDKFTLLRKVLRTIGLPPDAVDDLVDRVVDLLSEKPFRQPKFPYHLQENFLSPAEHNFYLILKDAVQDQAIVCPKVSLGDLFYAKSSDYGEYLTYTNKIDRKHVDFLLCHPRTIKPMIGIELDDGSHNRADRKERDEFVRKVYEAAKLPLLRVSVRHAYNVEELRGLIRQQVRGNAKDKPTELPAREEQETQAPVCPECGNAMVLRTAKRGPNQGGQFWGCSEYPRCRGIVQIEARST